MPSQNIEIPFEDSAIAAYFAAPASGASGGVIVVNTIFGVDDELKGVVDDLVDAGFAAAAPDTMRVAVHMCRGNQGQGQASGGYEPVAEILLDQLNYNGYFLEYDTERAGGFEPLRFLPKGDKLVVLGLVTSKSGELENRDDVKRRIDEASKFVDLDQLCLSPQCGFASTEEGNVLAEEQQWAKLREIIEISEEVWG